MDNKELRFAKFFLLTIVVILTFVVVGQYFMTTLVTDDLVKVSGQVTYLKQDRYKHYKYTDDRITILLKGHEEPFYTFDNHKDFFKKINEIQIGDNITLQHRTKFQSLIGTGDEFKIMQIEKNGEMVYPFDRAREQFGSVGKFTTYTTIILWPLVLLFWRYVNVKK